MTYDWYKITNLTEFEDTELVSRNFEVILEGVGSKNVLVTKGNLVSVLYDDVMLSLNLNEKNPFEFDGHAAYLDQNNDVWLGIAVDED